MHISSATLISFKVYYVLSLFLPNASFNPHISSPYVISDSNNFRHFCQKKYGAFYDAVTIADCPGVTEQNNDDS
jgi:hypothetical protein